MDDYLVKSAQVGRIDEAARRDPCLCAKIVQMTMEKAAVDVRLRISAAINRFDGSLDLGKDAQFPCHVERADYRHEGTGTVA
jgi:hypothetical protein